MNPDAEAAARAARDRAEKGSASLPQSAPTPEDQVGWVRGLLRTALEAARKARSEGAVLAVYVRSGSWVIGRFHPPPPPPAERVCLVSPKDDPGVIRKLCSIVSRDRRIEDLRAWALIAGFDPDDETQPGTDLACGRSGPEGLTEGFARRLAETALEAIRKARATRSGFRVEASLPPDGGGSGYAFAFRAVTHPLPERSGPLFEVWPDAKLSAVRDKVLAALSVLGVSGEEAAEVAADPRWNEPRKQASFFGDEDP